MGRHCSRLGWGLGTRILRLGRSGGGVWGSGLLLARGLVALLLAFARELVGVRTRC